MQQLSSDSSFTVNARSFTVKNSGPNRFDHDLKLKKTSIVLNYTTLKLEVTNFFLAPLLPKVADLSGAKLVELVGMLRGYSMVRTPQTPKSAAASSRSEFKLFKWTP
jgi:hypothetical protein